MLPLCPMNLYGRIFGDKSQTNMLPSSLPVIACFLWNLNVILKKFIELHVWIKNAGINGTCVTFVGTIKDWIGKYCLRKDFFWLF